MGATEGTHGWACSLRGSRGARQALGGGPGTWELHSTNQALCAGESGRLLWKDNWVSFLDAMLQISILGLAKRSLHLPTRITAIHIDPATHRQKLYTLQDNAQGSPFPTPTQGSQPTVPHSPGCPHSG